MRWWSGAIITIDGVNISNTRNLKVGVPKPFKIYDKETFLEGGGMGANRLGSRGESMPAESSTLPGTSENYDDDNDDDDHDNGDGKNENDDKDDGEVDGDVDV